MIRLLRLLQIVKARTVILLASGAVIGAAFYAFEPRLRPLEARATKILILKTEHKLLLMDGDEVLRTYRVSIGTGGTAPKEREGDHKSPEGLYTIDFRKPDSRFHRALHISYPNEHDREHARRIDAPPGGDIMIHGMQNGLGWIGKAHRLVDWTDGCIAVTDHEIEEIWSAVPDGTPVEIRR